MIQKINWVSFISFHFYITNQKKNNFFFFENILEFQQQILPLKCINHVGVLISNPSAIQFSYKCEFTLCKNWETSYKDIKTLNCYSSTQ